MNIIEAICAKKELSGISRTFVTRELERYLTSHPKALAFLEKEKSKEFKLIVKDMRAHLRRVYGLYRSSDKLSSLVDQLLSGEDVLEKVLSLHASTHERYKHYKELYSKIFSRVGKIDVLVDLGCGLNPFSYLFMELETLRYYAFDLSTDELAQIQRFFDSKEGLLGHTQVLDFTDPAALEAVPICDVALLFKVTDMIDLRKGHKGTEYVLSSVDARYMVVSFPTITMSGKPMNVPQRPWFERMCSRLGWEFESFILGDEIFYVVEK